MSMAAGAVATCQARSVSAPTAPQTRRARRVRRPAALPPVCPARPAFSLLELVVVLVIIGIAAAIAVPRHASALARYRARTCARRVAADLDRARNLARQASSDQTILFTPGADCYTLAGWADPDRPGQPYTVSLGGAPYHADLLGATFGDGNSVTFNGFGLPEDGGTVVLQVGAYTWTVSVDADTGEITTGGP